MNNQMLTTPDSDRPLVKDWIPVSEPPDIYEFVDLRFADGTVRRGMWTGKVWWGYNEKLRRSAPVSPESWRP